MEQKNKQAYDVTAFVCPLYTGDEPCSRIFWEEGYGEWQTVKNVRKNSTDKPADYVWDRKPLWGYVNEANPDVMHMQIDCAYEHGVNVFIYDWYWYNDRPFLENCLNDGYLKAKNNDLVRFYIMWANHDASHMWDVRTADTVGPEVLWHGDVINPEALAFVKELYTEYGTFFRELGYTSIRMWNDDVCRHADTGWQEVVQLDKSIGLQFRSSHTNDDRNTAQFYLDRGYELYNFCRAYNYYTMYPAGSSFSSSYVTPEAILREWTPYTFTPKDSMCDTKSNEYIFPKFNPGNHIKAPDARVKGAGFCLWTDTPAAQTEDELLEIIRPYFTAIGKKASGEA